MAIQGKRPESALAAERYDECVRMRADYERVEPLGWKAYVEQRGYKVALAYRMMRVADLLTRDEVVRVGWRSAVELIRLPYAYQRQQVIMQIVNGALTTSRDVAREVDERRAQVGVVTVTLLPRWACADLRPGATSRRRVASRDRQGCGGVRARGTGAVAQPAGVGGPARDRVPAPRHLRRRTRPAS